jgi:hypothetical protein
VRVPSFRIAEGAAPILQGYLEKALKDPKDLRLAVAPAKYEHAGDSARYAMATRPKPSDLPKPPVVETPDWLKNHPQWGEPEKQRRF